MEFSASLKVKAKKYFEVRADKELTDDQVQSYLCTLAELGNLFIDNLDKLEKIDSK